MRKLQLAPVASLTPFLGEGELVAFNVGPDGFVYLVVALRALDYRREAGGAGFAKTVPDIPQTYRVLALSGSQTVLDLVIENERFNIHDVQPLGNELLLVCARSEYRGPEDYDRNGRVYSTDGQLKREILLGDGIQSVQTTRSGTIWTSFFDEGVFGNFGWHEPVGASGLVAWDAEGRKIREFEPTGGLDSICDCYALNVASDRDVWCYYYTQFPLVHLQEGAVAAHWQMPLGGSDAFAVDGELALFRGGYSNRDTYRLFSLKERKPRELLKLQLQTTEGVPLTGARPVGRGSSLYLLHQDCIYQLDVATAARA